MEANLLERSVDDVLHEALSATTAPFVVNPGPATLEELIDVLADVEGPSARLLASEEVLKSVMADFLVASAAADLIETGRLEMRTFEEADNTLVVGEDSLVVIVVANDQVAGLTTEDEAFVEAAYDRYADAWEEATEFSLRTPPISRVRSTLEAEIGPDTAADFDAVLSSLETARGNGDGLDEVTISLLVAARNEKLLYDISKWGEDVGIASKATFSRTKSKLEDMGLIETEKVPIDVGRPRLRLMLGDDSLRRADSSELANAAQSLF